MEHDAKSASSTADTGQSGNGKITTKYDCDVNGMMDTLTDDNGNRTS